MKEEHANTLKKHQGYSSRVVGEVMANNGVDECVYNGNLVVGNQCMTLCENCIEVAKGVDERMKKVVKSPANVKCLSDLKDAITEIMKPLLSVMLVMKSAKRQTPATIIKFRADTILLNKAIYKFVTEAPVPGMKIDIPAFTKSHLLFDFHLQRFLEKYETLGALDEQNIEATHPVFNDLVRRYGSTRGRLMKRSVVKQFMLEIGSFILESIDEMVAATSKSKRPNAKKVGKMTSVADEADEDTSLYSSALTAMETALNANKKLHPETYIKNGEEHQFGNTCITACSKCVSGKRYLKFAEDVHNHEYHSGAVVQDVDDEVVQRIAITVDGSV